MSEQSIFLTVDCPDARISNFFLTYESGHGVHLPREFLPQPVQQRTASADPEPRAGATFLTLSSSVSAPRQKVKRRRAVQTPLMLSGASVEEDREHLQHWNDDFQAATEQRDATKLHDTVRAFETEVDHGIRAILDETVRPLLDLPGRYLYRGVYYLESASELDMVHFFGSVEAAVKAVDAEFRALKFLWSVTGRTELCVPLCTVARSFGRHFFACALPSSINADTEVAGPAAPRQYRIAHHEVARHALQRLCDELHLSPIYFSSEHRERHPNYPILGSPEIIVHYGTDRRVYALECARIFPPTDPRAANALLSFTDWSSSSQIAAQRPPSTRTSSNHSGSRGSRVPLPSINLLRTSENRFACAAKRPYCHRLLRPTAMKKLSTTTTTDLGLQSDDPRGDGISGVAFTNLSSPPADAVAVTATKLIVDSACNTLLTELLSSEVPWTDGPRQLAARMTEHSLNKRYLGDLYRIMTNRLVTSAPSYRTTTAVRGARQNSGDSVSVGKGNPTAPLSARAAIKADDSRLSLPALPQTARVQRDASLRHENEAALLSRQLAHERIATALDWIRVEVVARSFKTLCREQWALCFSEDAPDHGDKDVLDRMLEESVLSAAERNFVTGKATLSKNSVADQLLYHLKALSEDIELANDETAVRFKRLPAVELNRMWLVEATPQHPRYCRDTGEPFKPRPSSQTQRCWMILTQLRERTATLLSLLMVPDARGDRFWDLMLAKEIWTKYSTVGRIDELRKAAPAVLLTRVCQLLGISLHPGDPSVVLAALHSGEFSAANVSMLSTIRKSFIDAARNESDLVTRLKTPWSPLLLMPLTNLEKKVGVLREESPDSKELVDHLMELEQRLIAHGVVRRCDLALCRLSLKLAQQSLWLRRVAGVWALDQFEGILYVPCPSCTSLIDMSHRSFHRCSETEGSGGFECIPMGAGLRDGSLPDASISASSYRTGCRPHYARLDVAPSCGWEPDERDPSPWWQCRLTKLSRIVMLKLQGSRPEAFVSSFQLEYTADGENWRLFRGPYSHHSTTLAGVEPQQYTAGQRRPSQTAYLPLISDGNVVRLPRCGMFGAADGEATVTIGFSQPFDAVALRILPGGDGRVGAVGLRVEFFIAAELLHQTASAYCPGTRVVALSSVDLDARFGTSTRRALIDTEISALEAINRTERDVYSDTPWVDPMTGRARAHRHSKHLIESYAALIEQLEAWGPERAGDASALACRLLCYRIAEAELAQSQGQRTPLSLVKDVTPLIFAVPLHSSNALEALLRRLVALLPNAPPVVSLFKRLSRRVGKTHPLQPYLLSMLMKWLDPGAMLSLSRYVADASVADSIPDDPSGDELSVQTRDLEPDLEDSPKRRGALLVLAHRSLIRMIEEADRVAL